MIDININVDGQVQMKRSLDVIDRNVSDLTPFWGDVLNLTETRVDEVFDNEGRNIQNANP